MRPRKTRGGGFSFFLVTLAVLAFALVYVFAGDAIFARRGAGMIFPAEGEIIVTFLDVGQGSGVVIRAAGHTVLIDGGEFRARSVVLDYLSAAGVTRLCYVIATHPHSDHIGALPAVLRDFEIGRLLMPDIRNDTEIFLNFLEAIENNYVEVHFPETGENFRAGIICLTVISHPPGPATRINDASVVLRMEHGDTSFLFTGDAEAAAERAMLSGDLPLNANVLLVGHHGSRTSTTEAFLSAVAPAAAVIQSAADNRHGHPHPDVIDRLHAHGVTIFRTDELGTIRKITNGQTILLCEKTN